MNAQEVEHWIKDRGLQKTEAAFVLGISYPTLNTILRGAAPSDETVRLMKERMAKYDQQNKQTA